MSDPVLATIKILVRNAVARGDSIDTRAVAEIARMVHPDQDLKVLSEMVLTEVVGRRGNMSW